MAMINCMNCEQLFSNSVRDKCPKCGTPVIAKIKRKGLFTNKTLEELNDPLITPPSEMRARVAITLSLIAIPVIFILTKCVAAWNDPAAIEARSPEAERCRLIADLHAKAGGAKTYRYAVAVSATNAKLVFSNNGVRWKTNYFCD